MADPAHHATGTHGAGGPHTAHGGHGAQGGGQAHAGHSAHAGHAGHGPARDGGWRTAVQATLHCLTGCAIGEVLGMILGTALGLHNGATVVLSVALAFVFGYALTMRGVLRAGLPVRRAVKVALAADTVSILVMELIDNTVMVTVPGAMDAGLGNALFWAALAGSLALAFVLTVPVNRWMIARGRGHAVVHAHHRH
ncbi:DUF4396 domain-containing protein [Kitasatospora indigofera]|uniref:DUF4396 domain-containing protein n=1 Tax=Kitasatospora indigofera TaxID=67307 RepID=UPI00167D1C7E|nr:DUF4396 domain-containing protein [Kitasatospora indigofera]